MWQPHAIFDISIPQPHHKLASGLCNYRKESNLPTRLNDLAKSLKEYNYLSSGQQLL